MLVYVEHYVDVHCHVLCCVALGMGLCVAFIALVRVPSLKVSTLLLLGLLVYDVFWVSVCALLDRDELLYDAF